MRVSRPVAAGPGLEAAAPAEADLAAGLEEVQAAVVVAVMAPVGDMALEGVEQVLAVVAMGQAAVEEDTAPAGAEVQVVEAPERDPVTAAELEMEPAEGREAEERAAVGARALDLAAGALVVALAPVEDQEAAQVADMDPAKAVDLEAADQVDRDSDLVVAVLVVEVALDLGPAAALGDLVEVVREGRALDLAEVDQALEAEVRVERVPQLEEARAAAQVPV
jgi:hypothetical protein